MSISRSGWVLASLAFASLAWLVPQLGTLSTAFNSGSFPDVLLAAGCTLQLVVAACVLFPVALSVLGGSSRLVSFATPALLQRVLFVGAAGAIAVAPAHGQSAIDPPQTVLHSLDGLRLPDRPHLSAVPLPATRHTPHVIVEAGDTLWAISRRALPANADEQAIAIAVRRWHEANLRTIGPDPDVLHPGQRLIPPTDGHGS